MAIRAVVFDIGGVLEFTPDTGMTEKWEARFQRSIEALDKQLKLKGIDPGLGPCSEEEWRDALREIGGLDQTQLDEFLDDFWKDYLGQLNVELADYLHRLRPRYQTALLSNSCVGARSREKTQYHFDEIADFIIYSHEVGIAKPDRRIYELTCERLGLRPGEVVFLDDAELNVVAAHEFGLHAILFKDTPRAIADIEACLNSFTP